MKFSVKNALVTLPVTLQEVKDHLRLTHDTQDALLTSYLQGVVEDIELHTSQTLAPTEFYGYTDTISEEISVPKYPIMSLTSVKYYDTNGNQQTMDSGNYRLDNISIPAKVILTEVPSVYDRSDAVTIEFKAGYTVVPPAIKNAILLQVAYLYENSGDNPKQLLTASERLLSSFRLFHSV